MRDLVHLNWGASLGEHDRLAGICNDDVPEDRFLPELKYGVLKILVGGAVVIQEGVVRVRRLEVARNCERQGGERERPEAGGSLQQRDRGEHGPITDFKLLKYVVEVYFDCASGNVQLARNLLVRQTFGHESHDFALAAREHPQHFFNFGAVYFLPVWREVLGRFRSRTGALRHQPQGMQNGVGVCVLRNCTASAGRDCRGELVVSFGFGKERQPSGKILGPRNGEDLGYRQVRQRVINERDVGCQIPNRIEAACSAATRRNNLEVVLCCE